MLIEEGAVTLATGAVAVGAGNVTVNNGATLVTDSSLRLSATAGATMTLDGGELRTTNPGNAGTFYDTDFAITLNAAGGTFSYTVPNLLNIVQTATTISGPGSLTKTGVGVLAIAGSGTYAGATIINDGELRIRTAADRLPVTTPVTVNSPGILNLNGVSQRIGSLSGNGLVGLVSGTLTLGDDNDTTFTG
jgi:autotransporter-associated beta strand protein